VNDMETVRKLVADGILAITTDRPLEMRLH
jgi:hypothetical protein